MRTKQIFSEGVDESELNEVAVNDKAHSWRVCPIGMHYVRTHTVHVPPSHEHPEGQVVTRDEHCAENPTHKDMLSYDEIQVIDKTHFSHLVGSPRAGVLIEYLNSDDYDSEIRGWVRYWNELFHALEPLDPNLVKALIASESSFKSGRITPQSNHEKNTRLGPARGLMQIIDSTLSIMGDHHGEMRNHFIDLTHAEVLNTSANICAGVRWLFLKKITAAARLHHPATWDDAVAEYKGVLSGIIEGKKPDPQSKMAKFRSLYLRFFE